MGRDQPQGVRAAGLTEDRYLPDVPPTARVLLLPAQGVGAGDGNGDEAGGD